MSEMGDVIIQDLQDYIKRLQLQVDVDEAILSEKNSYSDDMRMMIRSRIRMVKRIIGDLESIIGGRGIP